MINFEKYHINSEDREFIELIYKLIENQNEFTLKYKDYSFLVEPSGQSLRVWHFNKFRDYENLENMFLNMEVYGKKLIEVISDIDFD